MVTGGSVAGLADGGDGGASGDSLVLGIALVKRDARSRRGPFSVGFLETERGGVADRSLLARVGRRRLPAAARHSRAAMEKQTAGEINEDTIDMAGGLADWLTVCLRVRAVC